MESNSKEPLVNDVNGYGFLKFGVGYGERSPAYGDEAVSQGLELSAGSFRQLSRKHEASPFSLRANQRKWTTGLAESLTIFHSNVKTRHSYL
jgi:hypothetical protein